MTNDSARKPELMILDLGRQKKRAIRELKQGSGPLIYEIQEAAREAVARHAVEGKEAVPVIILYRKRSRKPRTLLSGILQGL